MAQKQTWTEKLTLLQKECGYTFNEGVLDNIAVLGFAGEAGEVIETLQTVEKEYEVSAKLSAFVYAGRSVDFIKKAIRDGHMPQVGIKLRDYEAFINELADHFYYFNAICNNIGISFETLAEIVYKKALANHEANPNRRDKR